MSARIEQPSTCRQQVPVWIQPHGNPYPTTSPPNFHLIICGRPHSFASPLLFAAAGLVILSLLSPFFHRSDLTMRILAAFAVVLSIPALFAPLAAASHADRSAGVARAERHRRVADSSAHVQNTTVTKRDFSGARFTYYYDSVAQVACGGWHQGSDFVRVIRFYPEIRVLFVFVDCCHEYCGMLQLVLCTIYDLTFLFSNSPVVLSAVNRSPSLTKDGRLLQLLSMRSVPSLLQVRYPN